MQEWNKITRSSDSDYDNGGIPPSFSGLPIEVLIFIISTFFINLESTRESGLSIHRGLDIPDEHSNHTLH